MLELEGTPCIENLGLLADGSQIPHDFQSFLEVAGSGFRRELLIEATEHLERPRLAGTFVRGKGQRKGFTVGVERLRQIAFRKLAAPQRDEGQDLALRISDLLPKG